MFISIILFPLLSFVLILTFGSFIGTMGSAIVSCLNMLLASGVAVVMYYQNAGSNIIVIDLWDWVKLNGFVIKFALKYDSISAIMFIVVLFVSTIVHLYSVSYMYTDPFLSRFMSYLSLFTFFMLVLVASDNLLVLFLGWEGVGLCSYLLISFWYTRIQTSKAASKAFIINKIGDIFLLAGICVTYSCFFSVNISTVTVLLSFCDSSVVDLITFLLFVGVVGKSAQIGLHTWLPDAMEGPTPVSALIHAATMVTAGIVLVIKCAPIFELGSNLLYIMSLWGGITALISGIIGSVQNDIKKIIAYSTCSQLGYMLMACGLSYYSLSLFHLFNHAFFKALLFLSAGSIIHALDNEQDVRKMGGLRRLFPVVFACVTIASLSLTGAAFLSGFYSKDLIIEFGMSRYQISAMFIYWLSNTSAALTAFYSWRLLYNVFIKEFGGDKISNVKSHSMSVFELVLLIFLAICGIISGFLLKDAFVGAGSTFFSNFEFNWPSNVTVVEAEFIPEHLKMVPVLFSLAGFFTSLHFSKHNKKFNFEGCKWFYNEVMNSYISLPVFKGGRFIFEQHEKRTLEFTGPEWFVNWVRSKFN